MSALDAPMIFFCVLFLVGFFMMQVALYGISVTITYLPLPVFVTKGMVAGIAAFTFIWYLRGL
jgi:hypothetical protein